MSLEWEKFRLAFEGGRFFKTKYLKKFSTRETTNDFNLRREISYVPAHAKAAILDIRNAIFKRMVDITRKDGPDSYTRAVAGLNHGVDGKGNSMNSFMGQVILPELMVMGRVGLYVDKPQILSDRISLAEARKYTPYIYHYQAEDIFSWHYNEFNMLDVVLLRDHDFTTDHDTGLIDGEVENFRLLKLVEIDGRNQVELKRFGLSQRGPGLGSAGPVANRSANPPLTLIEEPVIIDIPEIPFVLMELHTSLMTDIADYQVSLLNLASSDVNYALKSNFPFYTEQFSPGMELPNLRQAEVLGDGTSKEATSANSRQQKTGVSQGRRYAMGTDRPGFIHPSSEPLIASMKLQEKMQKDIRELVNLNLTNTKSTNTPGLEGAGIEGGLANIGLECEFGERNVGRIWSAYESDKGGEVTVKYPDNYDMRTDEDRRKEASELRDILPTVPSKTFQKQTTKDIISIMQGHKVSLDELQKMHSEIERAVVIVTDPLIIRSDHESGFVGDKLASELRGYPKGESERAAKDHAKRAARIVTAQMAEADMKNAQARGAPDLDADTDSGVVERDAANDTTTQMSETDRTRGEGQ
jgi:hypothetical protein